MRMSGVTCSAMAPQYDGVAEAISMTGDVASTTRRVGPQLQPKERSECFRLTIVVTAGGGRLRAKGARRFRACASPLAQAEDWPHSRKQSATAARPRPS